MKRPSSLSSKQQVRMSVPINSQWSPIKKIQQNIIKFPYSAYPFPNQTVSVDLFNTIVQCHINEQKIDKIVNFKCQNVIGLKKIVKIKKKDKNFLQSGNSDRGKNTISTYSFYYEKVDYSLGFVLESKSKQSIGRANKFNLDRVQIKKTLASVIASLYKQGIVSFLEFPQIGVSQTGIIKVYIAPNVFFDRQEYNPKTKVLILTCLNNVLKEIDSKFPKTLHNKHSIESFKFQPEFSIEKDIIESEQSFFIEPEPKSFLIDKNQQIIKDKKKKLFAHQEKSFNQEEQNFIGASGSTNLEHLKLHKQMNKKFQNHKLASKVEQNIKSQKKSKILIKLEQKNKIEQLTFKLQEMRRKIRQKIEQKRQKNVFGSKILKTLATQDHTQPRERVSVQTRYKKVFGEQGQSQVFEPAKRAQLEKKRKSSQSSINFYQGVISHQKNINCINIYNPKRIPQKSYYQMAADDGISADTYELQIGDDYQMPNLNVPQAMRNSMSPQKVRQSFKNVSQLQGNFNGQKSRFSESAGGKSYGNIVNLLKPQFAPKKSNIFEEPQNENDQDSKHSISLKKSMGKQHSDQLSIEKRLQNNITTKHIASPTVGKNSQIKGLKTVQQFKKDLKNIMHIGKRSPEKSLLNENKKKFQNRLTLPISQSNSRNPEMDLMFLRETEYRPKTNHKISDILIKKCALQQKVKKAMQRTKNAINVLQTAKIRQSGSLNTLKGIFSLE